MTYTYRSAILGGTFDHLHLGHARFLSTAFAQAKHLTIGLVQNLLSTDKSFIISLEDYAQRLATLRSELSKLDVSSRAEIIPLSDIFGTSLTDPSIQAIFVTQATHANAGLINDERSKLAFPPLRIITIPYELGDDSQIISSGRIRAGLIDRQGHSYLKLFKQKKTYHLPNSLRASLQTPLGTVITDLTTLSKVIPPQSSLISVGDIVSLDLYQAGYTLLISIIDHHTRRHAIDPQEIQKYFPVSHHRVTNKRGTINPGVADIFLTSLKSSTLTKQTQVIFVEGEEDLLTLPAILLSPLDTYVIYGQYQVGMCIVKVTEELKTQTKLLLAQFV
jgi:cytidyltransferase-like protein